jgi:ABC-2 type transport system permease protein
MPKWWLVAKREFLYNIRRPAFIFASFVMPFLLALVLFIVFSLISNTFTAEVTDPIGYVDASGVLADAVDKPDNFTAFPDEDAAEAALQAETLRAYFTIGTDYLQTGDVTIVRNGDLSPAAEDAIEDYLLANLAASAENSDQANLISDPVDMEIRALDSGRTLAPEGVIGLFLAPFIFMIVFMITVSSTSSYLMSGVVEEKSNRIMEILITSVTPFQMLAGKIVGLGLLGLMQIGVWLILGALVITFGAGSGNPILSGVNIPLDVVVIALVFFTLDYFLTAAIMASIGAVTGSEQESRAISGLFGFVTAIPFFFIFAFFDDPNGPIPVFLTLFPFTSPLVVILRSAFTTIPPLELLAAFVILVITTLVIMWIGARIFRLSLLMYGKRPSLGWLLGALRGGSKMQTTATGDAT